MILHLVLFRFHDGVSWEDPRALAAERLTRNHPSHIPQIGTWIVSRDASGRTDAADLGIVATFEDAAALATYAGHEDHLRGVAAWREISTWTVLDTVQPDGVDLSWTGAA